ncbi:uncharacterized protein LOC115634483 [Scaptodrosophila lebanonensis]|uniref:Uncharacterized protein LOC115634483 n=1 Tax=Drosophila lebanonensis TaxID=7225 RepID=A0A6J2UIL8_DROLE|nr:uncharacterized protein LOC115634483 [Scaptodrosophila lebanonensis]
MSIVLNFVQQVVLQNAYELTVSKAEQVLSKYTSNNTCKKLRKATPHVPMEGDGLRKKQTSMPEIRQKKESRLSKRRSRKRSKSTSKSKSPALELRREWPRSNSGPIVPPQTPSMERIRDSYFS